MEGVASVADAIYVNAGNVLAHLMSRADKTQQQKQQDRHTEAKLLDEDKGDEAMWKLMLCHALALLKLPL